MYKKTIICITCNKKIKYKTKRIYATAVKNKIKKCRGCKLKEYQSQFKDKVHPLSKKMSGKNNPFYGKKHTKETKKKLSDRNMTGWNMSRDTKGNKNPMYGKKVYDIWVEKYGEEEAKKRDLKWKKKLSKAFSGKNNPMYGKSPPIGSGNGCSGWYNGHYFRSLAELNYILYLESQNIKWSTAEIKKYRVKYKNEQGKDKTYCPDFIINNDTIIECKPKPLWNTVENILKRESAEKYFKKIGLIYQIVDPGYIDNTILRKLIKNGKVKMLNKSSNK